MTRALAIGLMFTLASACTSERTVPDVDLGTVELKQARALRNAKGAPFTASTQAMARPSSALRQLTDVEFELIDGRVEVTARSERGAGAVKLMSVDPRAVVPTLPYRVNAPDAFDLANLLLAEYARMGVKMPRAPTPAARFEETVSDEIRPTRFGLFNNCLAPGRFELSASIASGEVWHGWFMLPVRPTLHGRDDALAGRDDVSKTYLDLVRAVNGFDVDDETLLQALTYRDDLGTVPLALGRLRAVRDEVEAGAFSEPSTWAFPSWVGGESRRKVSRGFITVLREGQPVTPKTRGELKAGDVFRFPSFVEPGVYTWKARDVTYAPWAGRVVLRRVSPRASWNPEGRVAPGTYLEIELLSESGPSLVMGNVPLDELSDAAEFRVPAFGAGVPDPSELSERVERRALDAIAAPYAYAFTRKASGPELLNNHALGWEGVSLRLVDGTDGQRLRLRVNSYERIFDLYVVEAPLGEAVARWRGGSAQPYLPPAYRTVRDDHADALR